MKMVMELNHVLLSRNQLSFIGLTIYSAHSRPPWSHSYTNPRVSKIIISIAQKNVCIGSGSWSAQGRGRRSAISRSNNKNRMATKKNRIEKGSRAEPIGSKPHSYGESFSGSGFICGSQNDTTIRMHDRAVVIIMIEISEFIIFPWGLTKIK